MPRHSPYALSCLTIAWNTSDTIRLLMFVNCLCNLLNLFLDFFDYMHIFSFQGAVVFTSLRSNGGDYEIRTRDPLLARQVLSQLS